MMRRPALVLLVLLVAIAACGCGRKAKPEPLWGASRIAAITEPAR